MKLPFHNGRRLTLGVTVGLIAALYRGATDFLAGWAARLVGVRKAVLVSNLVGFAALAVY